MRYFFLLFITVPILEMWVLIEVGSRIGALNTIALVFLTAIAGLALLRQQGLDTLLRVNQKMQQGQLPAEEILSGLMLAIGGALLLTPGFVTDLLGFACLLPPTRKLMVVALVKRGILMATQQGAGFQRPAGSGTTSDQPFTARKHFSDSSSRLSGDVLDGEYRRDD
ncbi:FxsA family protein [Oceanicoccus sp. KOV_DT_Chl]|uniref:FxsA family protein n=1 Tax=Oceanicoccus sp. KOV_DT_Chl TaxID=1904639 RepID=UPI000C7B313F|nr:FxsA family protein [Oceanicoccus sp. KOV_DT_Chl]